MVDDTRRRGGVATDWSVATVATVEFARTDGGQVETGPVVVIPVQAGRSAATRAIPARAQALAAPVAAAQVAAAPVAGARFAAPPVIVAPAAATRVAGAPVTAARVAAAPVTAARVAAAPATAAPTGGRMPDAQVLDAPLLDVAAVAASALAASTESDPAAATTGRPFADRVSRPLLIIAVVLVLLSIGLPNIAPEVAFFAAPGSPIRMFFGVSEEANLPTFFSVLVLAAAAGAHVLAATVSRQRSRRVARAFLVTATILFTMAFDDFVSLHERLYALGAYLAPDGLAGSAGPTTLWVLPGLILATVVVAAFATLLRRMRGRVRRDLAVGLAILLGAALGLEILNGVLDAPGTDGVLLQLGTHLEELLEHVGAILLLRGALLVVTVSQGASRCTARIDADMLAPAAAHRRGASGQGGQIMPHRGADRGRRAGV